MTIFDTDTRRLCLILMNVYDDVSGLAAVGSSGAFPTDSTVPRRPGRTVAGAEANFGLPPRVDQWPSNSGRGPQIVFVPLLCLRFQIRYRQCA